MQNDIIIGLMSGTSVDGIDASLVSFNSENKLSLIDTLSVPFEPAVKTQVNELALSGATLEKSDYAELDQLLARNYASACEQLLQQSGYKKEQITAIANHGQTIRHEPNASPAYSLQIGDAQLIADLTGITTIADFRQADINAGGQGAPLMPAFHQSVFAEGSFSERTGGNGNFVVNIGGVANITSLGDTIVGFDTGPGNTLLDQWIYHSLGKDFDDNGAWAKSGSIQKTLLVKLLQDPYFSQPYPKSTGTDYFNLEWLRSNVGSLDECNGADLQATLLALTIETIALAVEQLAEKQNAQSKALYLCGGGAHNGALFEGLQHRLPELSIQTTDKIGIASDWVESIGFAWLGYCQLHQIASNLPSVTGASKKLVLGERYLPRPTSNSRSSPKSS